MKIVRNFLFLIIAPFLISCGENDAVQTFSGQAQGTYYTVTYTGNKPAPDEIAGKIDSLLNKIDLSLSTYVETSLISRFNSKKEPVEVDSMFIDVFQSSENIHFKTGGAFDPTIAPVVNAWGFGFTEKSQVDSALIDSLMKFTGFERIGLQGGVVTKDTSGVMLDFNAIAQGYSVDIMGELLEKHGIENYLIELGGEIKGKGDKYGQAWRVGIDKPVEIEEGRKIHGVMELNDLAMATSGNYRKFYVEDGKKYSHTIRPMTGYPVEHSLLSATVVAPSCMEADGYATAFMVLGLEESKKIAEREQLGIILIYTDQKGGMETFVSNSLKDKLSLE